MQTSNRNIPATSRNVTRKDLVAAAIVVPVMTFLWGGPQLFPDSAVVRWMHDIFIFAVWPAFLIYGYWILDRRKKAEITK